MPNPDHEIQVQICYAKPGEYALEECRVPRGATVHDAIKLSGIVARLPEIDLTVCRVGIYGKLKSLDTTLRNGDRIEIYRPLLADPKESRRKRAGKKNNVTPV